jgi:succinate dehydrogenase / fumarate reductase cytochrome b subunit
MAMTGLMLIGFLITHLVGNLSLFAGDDGAAFNEYAEFISSLPFLPIAEIGLALLFIGHIFLAVKTTIENRRARPIDYEVKATHGEKTFASQSMFLTGVVILVFLIKHLWDFRIQKENFDADEFGAVQTALGDPLTACVYILGILALGIHLSHAFGSAFQSLGFNHPKYTPVLRITGKVLALLLTLGFVSLPLYFWLGQGGA